MRKNFNSASFVFVPTKMAEQLSALTQRPVTFKRVPVATVEGRPIQIS